MSRFLLALLAVCSLMLGACASKDELVLEPLELQDFKPSVKIDVLWSHNIGKGQDVRYTQLVPAVVGSSIVATDIAGKVMALDRETGKAQWTVKFKDRISAGVSAGGGLLFLGTYDAEVIALDATDGSEVWRTRVSSEVLAPPQTNGTVVAVQTLDGHLTALDQKTGKQLWDYEVTMPPLTLRGTSVPVITRDSVYVGFANGKIYALELANGLLQWEQRVAIPQGRGDFEKMVDVDASPLLVGEILFCASFQGELVALSRATGRPLWNKPISTYTNMSAGQGNLYVSNDESSVKAFRTGSGEINWENNLLLRRRLNGPQVIGNYVAVADQEGGYLHILNQSDGLFAARKKINGSGVRSPMVTDGDVLYVLANNGDLVAVKIVPL